jgi:hypothetical protein
VHICICQLSFTALAVFGHKNTSCKDSYLCYQIAALRSWYSSSSRCNETSNNILDHSSAQSLVQKAISTILICFFNTDRQYASGIFSLANKGRKYFICSSHLHENGIDWFQGWWDLSTQRFTDIAFNRPTHARQRKTLGFVTKGFIALSCHFVESK